MSFAYNADLVHIVRNIDARCRWNPTAKEWEFPAEGWVIQRLIDLFGIDRMALPPSLEKLLEPPVAPPPPNLSLVEHYPWILPPYHHQRRGLAELVEHKRWLLGWEMGVGKTPVAVARLRYGIMAGEFTRPILIYCPKSMLGTWPEELKAHGNLGCTVISGTTEKRKSTIKRGLMEAAAAGNKCPIFLTNFASAQYIPQELIDLKADAVIVDEAHNIKNSTTMTSRRIRKSAEFARYRWAMTGTPAPNGPLDIFGILLFLDPRTAGTESKLAFEAQYAIKKALSKSDPRRVTVGYQNLNDLQKRVASISSRLKKDDCLDLPPKTFSRRSCWMEGQQLKVYNEIRNEAVAMLESKRGKGELTVQNILTESLRLLQIAGGFLPDNDGVIHPLEPNAKMPVLEDILDEIGDTNSVVIWTKFREELRAVLALLDKRKETYVQFHGDVNDTDRAEAIKRFQNGDVQRFVSTVAAGGTGITLTRAPYSVYYSRDWKLTDWLQSQDRVHRITQTQNVSIITIQAEGTVDVKVHQALEAKRTLQEILMEGAKITDIL